MKHLEGLSVLIVLALGLAVAGFLAIDIKHKKVSICYLFRLTYGYAPVINIHNRMEKHLTRTKEVTL